MNRLFPLLVPYLIDGNNLLGSWGGPSVPGDGRAEVVRRVAAFCRERGARATIVFDGAPFRPELGGDQDLGLVSLRFPSPGRDADSVIREILDAAARPRDLLLVSSDKALYSYARTRGASALRVQEWNALARGAALPARRSHRLGASGRERSDKPERETDVLGWLKRFSGE
jgi:predicted RNA-binding protein with PIN domain